jgi:3-phenylpropionate/trans-cinnamate dioxygenase ferredoxin reductase subunit
MGGIVIIGAGQAGSSLAARLRKEGHAGAVTLIGAEPEPPYQRPPLSKKYLLGEMEVERLYIRPPSFYEENAITLRLGVAVEAVDAAAKTVRLADGSTLAYDRLAFTTGARPHLLPAAIGGALGGVYPVRTLADVDAMAAEFAPGRRVLIVGGGYIGLEAAAVAASRGVQVTLVEMADRILQRVACPETSAFFRDLHAGHRVDIREGVGLKRLTGTGRVTGAELADGAALDIDFALVGIGVAPDTALAEAAGAEIDNGIAVDAHCATTLPDIYAAGDCASFPWRGRRIRLESVQNAIDQAECAALNMMGRPTEYAPSPWFWSDQYDVKLQIAGLNTGYNRIVARPGAREGAVSHWYYRGAALLAVDAMNDPRAYMTGKRWLEAGHSPDPDALADPEADLKTL